MADFRYCAWLEGSDSCGQAEAKEETHLRLAVTEFRDVILLHKKEVTESHRASITMNNPTSLSLMEYDN